MVEAEEVSEIDFSSCRLLVGTNDSTIFADSDNILSAYNGVYLLKYSSAEETKLAYNDLLSKAEFVNVDSSSFAVADDSIQDIESQVMSEDLNPISELAEADITETMGTNVIAVIDTGSDENPNVIERVSMLGDDVDDDNGHGNSMISNIVNQNPNAQIISIKAMDANGVGTVSSIYAALQYAIEKKVSYINMSFVGLLNEETSIIKDVIQTAIDNGITVVGAAGNKGMDASLFVPGVVADAYIIGAADVNGTRLDSSNYGSNVDYNVVASSTSEASSLFMGYLSHYSGVLEGDINNGLIYATDYVYEEPTSEVPTEETTEPTTEEAIVETPTDATAPTIPEDVANEVSKVEKLPVDTSKKVAIKYLYVDKDEVPNDRTIFDQQVNHIEDTLYQTEGFAYPYRDTDGTYKVIADSPFVNGSALGKAMDVAFAKGNDNGDVVTEGVQYDYNTNIVTLSEDSLVKSNETDTVNLQIQIMIPSTIDSVAKIEASVKDASGKEVSKGYISAAPYDYVGMTFDTVESVSVDDVQVYLNNSTVPVDKEFVRVIDNELFVLEFAGTVKSIKVELSKNYLTAFKVSYNYVSDVNTNSISKANVIGYLKDGTDVSAFTKNKGFNNVTCHVGISGYSAYPDDPNPLGHLYGLDHANTDWTLGTIGIPTSLGGVNLQMYDSKGKSKGNWGSKYNHGVVAKCTHANLEWESPRKISGVYTLNFYIRVLDKYTSGDETTIVFGIQSKTLIATSPKQSMGGVFKVKVKNPKIKLQMQKDSSVPGFNSVYSREGAKYYIYTDKGFKNHLKYNDANAFITIDANGYGKLGSGRGINNAAGDKGTRFDGRNSGADISIGTYYAREEESPTSGLYALGSKSQSNIYKFVNVNKKDSNGVPIYRAHYCGSNGSGTSKGTPVDDPYINLQLKKVSANPEMTNGSTCYSYKGAVYGIYTTKAKASDANYKKASNQFGTITTDKDGYGCYITNEYGYGTNTNDTDPVYRGKKSGTRVRVSTTKTGDFEGWFVRELTAPKGYELDKTIYELKDSGKTSSKGCKIYRPNGNSNGIADPPGNDPVTVSIKKTDPITGEQIRLPNAIFKLEYYNSYLDESKYGRDFELDTSKSGYTNPFGSSSPTRTWYIKTGSNGGAALRDDWIITSGTYKSDERYLSKGGTPVVPYGTLVVSEVVSPDPDTYKVSPVNYYRKVDEEGISSAVRLNFEIPEPRVPSIDTVAVDNSTRSHTALVSANSSITDKITYVGLNPGETYTMKGYVVEKSTQTKYSSIKSKSFTTGTDGTGTVSLTHTFASDGSNGKATLVGKSVVAFAQVVDSKGKVICSHMDVNDSDQTVSYLGDGVITTKASFDVFEDLAVSTYHPVKLGVFNNVILDTVYGKGFGGNKRYNLYTMVFKVNNGVIGDPVNIETMIGPIPYERSTVTTKADGSFEYTVDYVVDSSKIDNESYVVYEFLSIDDYSTTLRNEYYKGNNVWDTKGVLKFFTDKAESGELSSYHADPKDADQTIDFVVPEITSNAYPRGSSDRKQAYISGNKRDTNIVETLKLSKLNKGIDYAIAPYVYVVENGKRVPLPADIAEKVKVYLNNELISNNIEGGTFKLGLAYDGIFSFTSVSATQTLLLRFDFSACKDYIKGKTITFGEELGYYDGEYFYSFAEHNTNILSESNPIETNQTIDFIEATVTTTAISPDTDTHYAYALGNSIDVVDTVSMTGLIPGKNYRIVGWLVDKSTNTAIPNTRVTKVITASNESQSVDIPLSLPNPSKYSDVVVFEELRFADNQIIATHKGITDKNQTITLLNPTIDTIASTNRTSEVHSTHHRGAKVSVYDTVSLTGLIVGKQYTIVGQLINKNESLDNYLEPAELSSASCSGATVTLLEDNKTATVVFTATAESQNLMITYVANSGLGNVTYVATEELLYQDTVIASHTDYDDEDQTVEYIGVGDLTLTKLDSFSGDRLGGVKFNIYSVDDKGTDDETDDVLTLIEDQFIVNGNYSTGTYYYIKTPRPGGLTDLTTKTENDMGVTTPPEDRGILNVRGLPEGKYKLVEVQTLAGYKVVIEDGVIFDVVGGDTTELEVTNTPIFTSINLIKTDDNEDPEKAKPLEGAGFTLYTDADCTKVARDFYNTVYSEVVTDESGMINFGRLRYDTSKGSTYYLKETTTPEGYIPLDYTIKVVVDKEGNVTYYAVSTEGKETLITDHIKYDLGEENSYSVVVTRIINKRGSVILEKQDENGESIKGSEWNLYRVDGTTEELVVLDSVKDGTYRCSDSTKGMTTLVTDDTGNLKIENLPLGDYYLVEVSSPDNHIPYGDKIMFSLTEDKPDLVGGDKIVVKDNVKLLPKTGGQGNTIMFLSIPCLTIALIALALYKRKAKSVRNIY